MQMVTVGVRTDNGFVFIAQQPPRKFNTGFVRLFWRHFARRVGMDDVIPENPTIFVPSLLCRLHLQKCVVQRTVDCGLESSFDGIADVIYGVPQIRLAVVLNIIQAPIQPGMNDDDLIVCHYIDSRTSSHASRAKRAASWICACVT